MSSKSKWTPRSIRTLRLRLGWSLSEFSHRMGCSVETINRWEIGESQPTTDDIMQLHRLEFHLSSYIDVLSTDPQADRILQEHKLEQIHRDQVAQ